jgi:hypothetical protein
MRKLTFLFLVFFLVVAPVSSGPTRDDQQIAALNINDDGTFQTIKGGAAGALYSTHLVGWRDPVATAPGSVPQGWLIPFRNR